MRHKFWPIAAVLIALAGLMPPALAAEEFLPPEQAFTYRVESDGSSVTVHWTVAPGYYAYKAKMGMSSTTPGLTLAAPQYPKGEIHTDDYFGEQEVFRGQFAVTSKVTRSGSVAPEAGLQLKIQGCADAGLCYPPQTWDTKVKLPAAGGIDAILSAARAQSSGNDEFLDPEVAFRLEAVADGPDRVRLVWQIADGYYLYRSRLKAETKSDVAQLGQLVLPEGKQHEDEYFGKQEVYYQQLSAGLPVARSATTELQLPIDITYQGCADAGLCYPPITKTLMVSMPDGEGTADVGFISEQDRFASIIGGGNFLGIIAIFFVAGLGLAFTPCVLPMVPILSGIIAGSGKNVTTARAFSLSLTYVLGMALTYTVAGAAFAAAGQQVQAVFQQPWIVTLFAALFIVMALAMLGVFTFQMPAGIQSRLADMSNRQSAGTFGGVAVMGALSALIVTACVAPPLIGALVAIGQRGDVALGAAALFAMSIGMGTPLLVVGASAGKLLPRAGAWMDTVKRLFGAMMLGVAAWMLERIVPERFALLLWAVPVLVTAWILWTMVVKSTSRAWIARTVGAAAGVYGAALLAGAALGGTDPLRPIPQLAGEHKELIFKRVKSVADLQAEVDRAKAAGQPVMLDFYADWCVSCKEMEKYTFTDEGVQRALEGAVLLQADVTANDAEDQALLKHFGIFGPPTIAFYDATGRELRNFRVVGYMKAPEFAALVGKALPRS